MLPSSDLPSCRCATLYITDGDSHLEHVVLPCHSGSLEQQHPTWVEAPSPFRASLFIFISFLPASAGAPKKPQGLLQAHHGLLLGNPQANSLRMFCKLHKGPHYCPHDLPSCGLQACLGFIVLENMDFPEEVSLILAITSSVTLQGWKSWEIPRMLTYSHTHKRQHRR